MVRKAKPQRKAGAAKKMHSKIPFAFPMADVNYPDPAAVVLACREASKQYARFQAKSGVR